MVGVEQLAVAKNACREVTWKQLLNPHTLLKPHHTLLKGFYAVSIQLILTCCLEQSSAFFFFFYFVAVCVFHPHEESVLLFSSYKPSVIVRASVQCAARLCPSLQLECFGLISSDAYFFSQGRAHSRSLELCGCEAKMYPWNGLGMYLIL